MGINHWEESGFRKFSVHNKLILTEQVLFSECAMIQAKTVRKEYENTHRNNFDSHLDNFI